LKRVKGRMRMMKEVDRGDEEVRGIVGIEKLWSIVLLEG
jgi:hypothetical protein